LAQTDSVYVERHTDTRDTTYIYIYNGSESDDDEVHASRSDDPGAGLLHAALLHHRGRLQQGAQPLRLRHLPLPPRRLHPLPIRLLLREVYIFVIYFLHPKL